LHANDIVDGRLYGPAILAPGVDIVERVDLFIGKAVSDWLPTGQVP
jgi:hypothetical protein